MFEDAVEIGAAGQSPRPDPSRLADHGRRLQAAGQDIAVIVEAAALMAGLEICGPADRQNRPR
jgi:hypothetical protein